MLRQTVRDHINVLQTDLRKHFEHLHIRFGIVEEKRHNPRLAGKSEAEYVAILQSSNLPDPKMMDIAVPADLAYGQPDALPKRHGRPLQPSCKDSQRFDAAVSLLGLVGAGAFGPPAAHLILYVSAAVPFAISKVCSPTPPATGAWSRDPAHSLVDAEAITEYGQQSDRESALTAGSIRGWRPVDLTGWTQ
jgi:hypothetical protein